jgi:hypothetical protein
VAGTSADVASGAPTQQPTGQPTGVRHGLNEPLAARTEANPQPSPVRVEEVEDEDAEARSLEALNQMHEELQEKRRRVEAHQRQAHLQVISRRQTKPANNSGSLTNTRQLSKMTQLLARAAQPATFASTKPTSTSPPTRHLHP